MIALSTRTAEHLLNRLAEDEQFRTRVLQEPLLALGELGIAVDRRNVPSNPTLASRDAFRAEHAQMELDRPGDQDMIVNYWLVLFG